ncbi:3-hydroxyacyl-ACP dehydratase FabZ [Paraliomyxa miuraensis]|uniref:3-hydroxyacyl-ACP dehydratase FabZ n=1 Tax=Paraliomyxa miuraensis TaxID=376150 RepID=UPI0022580007|nr:3-hydroxyacyl-ACP dehydratase FabZ [Paraliomyxa miuraensis]MCX4244610.1 3-hydroxyacyl-ACP dehydratase FabZ [Paraliomyxa miuraensis]
MLDAVQVQRILPHRYPFLFIDRVESVDEAAEGGPSIVAIKMVSMSDPILQGHFPGNPIMPGVVQVEAMAQAAVVLAHLVGHFDQEHHHCLFLGIEKARFRAPVVPGERLEIRVKALRLGRVGKFEGEIRVGSQIKSSATITAVIEPKSNGPKDEEQDRT